MTRFVLDPAKASHVVTIDFNNLVYRSFHGHRNAKTSKGEKSGHVYGVLQTISSVMTKLHTAPHLAFVVAVEGRRPQHRLDLLPTYKGNRDGKKRMDMVPILFEALNMLSHLPVTVAFNKDYEADDVMASIVKFYPSAKHLLVTTDHDLFALVTDRVSILYKRDVMGLNEVEQKLGFPPSLVTLNKALYGDKSDNIPAIKGLNKKRTWGKIVRSSKNLGWENKMLARLYRQGVQALDLEMVAERAGVLREMFVHFEAIKRNHQVVKLCTPPITLTASPNSTLADLWLDCWEIRQLKDRMMGMFHTLSETPFTRHIKGDGN